MDITNACKNLRLTAKTVLIVSCVLLCGLFCFVFMLMKPVPEADFKTEVGMLTTNIRKHFQRNADYKSLNTSYVIEHNLVLKDMTRGGKIFSGCQNEIIIGRDINGHAVLPLEKHFVITYINLNRSNCIKLLTTDFDTTFGLENITVSNDKTYELTYGGQFPLPVTQKAAQSYCHIRNTVMLAFE
ncbi:MAG: hypothetical protein J6W11_05265 [Alphaproteobacteria bacterium]|nr:hypothetical protein [Alphaproteobacteria bacterium]